MFVTNTLGNPVDDEGWIPGILAPLVNSRKEANKIKRDEPITVVIGNPPYKEKAKGEGSWIEIGSKNEKLLSPLAAWMPPTAWGVGAHAKHLRNLYVYFWRWATWKVYDHDSAYKTGIVCFITVAGFLNGPGFQKMRDYLRRKCDDIWVIDCSPEGHQPEVNTRIFQAVQQPVCIVLASRSAKNSESVPGKVRFHALSGGHRQEKFKALNALKLTNKIWTDCPSDWRASFLPASQGAWATYPALEEFFVYNGSGTMPGRTWIIAPDLESLEKRWQALINAPADKKETLSMRTSAMGSQAINILSGRCKCSSRVRATSEAHLSGEKGSSFPPARYGYRSFDRQWIIPDNRVINQPNPVLWELRGDQQVFLTALSRTSPSTGPAITFTGSIPDLDHYKGSFGGRVFPLWSDSKATAPNLPKQFLKVLAKKYGGEVTAEDFIGYIASTLAHPGFVERYRGDLSTPGLRVPLTADAEIFREAADLGRTVIWLHTFGERMIAPNKGRPAMPPRLPAIKCLEFRQRVKFPKSPQQCLTRLAMMPRRRGSILGRAM